MDSTGSGQGPVADCCECGDEASGACATELVSYGFDPHVFYSDYEVQTLFLRI
jgi:hypothetical protein